MMKLELMLAAFDSLADRPINKTLVCSHDKWLSVFGYFVNKLSSKHAPKDDVFNRTRFVNIILSSFVTDNKTRRLFNGYELLILLISRQEQWH